MVVPDALEARYLGIVARVAEAQEGVQVIGHLLAHGEVYLQLVVVNHALKELRPCGIRSGDFA